MANRQWTASVGLILVTVLSPFSAIAQEDPTLEPLEPLPACRQLSPPVGSALRPGVFLARTDIPQAEVQAAYSALYDEWRERDPAWMVEVQRQGEWVHALSLDEGQMAERIAVTADPAEEASLGSEYEVADFDALNEAALRLAALLGTTVEGTVDGAVVYELFVRLAQAVELEGAPAQLVVSFGREIETTEVIAAAQAIGLRWGDVGQLYWWNTGNCGHDVLLASGPAGGLGFDRTPGSTVGAIGIDCFLDSAIPFPTVVLERQVEAAERLATHFGGTVEYNGVPFDRAAYLSEQNARVEELLRLGIIPQFEPVSP
jgi:hypothetical protein